MVMMTSHPPGSEPGPRVPPEDSGCAGRPEKVFSGRGAAALPYPLLQSDPGAAERHSGTLSTHLFKQKEPMAYKPSGNVPVKKNSLSNRLSEPIQLSLEEDREKYRISCTRAQRSSAGRQGCF